MNFNGKRILIIKPSSLGDVVHTLPVAHAIKRCYPASHIGWIIQKTFTPIIEHDPAVDELIPIHIPSTSDPKANRGAYYQAFKATLSTITELRRRFAIKPYDFVLDLHASFRSGLLALTNPGGMRIGFAEAKELNPLFQHKKLATNPDKHHAVDKNIVFANFLECPPEPQDFHVFVSGQARNKVHEFLSKKGITDSDIVVYANPAARWETKFWTVPAWAELADMLVKHNNIFVVFAGSPQDVHYIEQITKNVKTRVVSAAGKLNLAEAVALIERANVYVGVDSGPMHIAAFTGTPVVALFGPTEPDKVGPYGHGHKVITLDDLDCLGCRKRQCSDRQCLETMSPSTVYEATLNQLGL